LPYADIIVAGNEPFINSNAIDWDNEHNPVGVSAPITVFYKRVASHINDYMINKGVRSDHKLYMGAFTHVYGSAIQNTRSVKDLLIFANETPYIDGVDIHTHVKTMSEMEESFRFVSSFVKKPLTDSEYSYVFSMQQHFYDLISANDTHPFKNKMSFLEKYKMATATVSTSKVKAGTLKYTASTTIRDYMVMAEKDPVSIEEWNDLFMSRSWTIDHYLIKSNDIFKRYNVNGVTYQMGGAYQPEQGTDVNLRNDTPWFLTSIYTTGLVKRLLPTAGYPSGLPYGNYQYLNDFQKINKVPLTP
jgi:hypothetical protein